MDFIAQRGKIAGYGQRRRASTNQGNLFAICRPGLWQLVCNILNPPPPASIGKSQRALLQPVHGGRQAHRDDRRFAPTPLETQYFPSSSDRHRYISAVQSAEYRTAPACGQDRRTGNQQPCENIRGQLYRSVPKLNPMFLYTFVYGSDQSKHAGISSVKTWPPATIVWQSRFPNLATTGHPPIGKLNLEFYHVATLEAQPFASLISRGNRQAEIFDN